MKRLFMFFALLLLMTTTVFADTATSSTTATTNVPAPSGPIAEAHQFAQSLSPPESDYSVGYLSQIFGTVGNVLQGSSGQIMGKMFDIFNKGVLVVAVLWLCMTGLQFSFRAAQEGSFMGQNKNAAHVMLRIALGFALLVPSSTTGYSLLQDVFMKIVVQGVGLADQVWDKALNYLSAGGSLYIPPSTLANDSNIINNYLTQSGTTSSAPFIAQIFQNEVCMIASNQWQVNSDKAANPNAPTSYVNYQPIYDSSKGVVYFPGMNNEGWTTSQYTLTQPTSGSAFTTTASCGFALDYYDAQALKAKVNSSSTTGGSSGQSTSQSTQIELEKKEYSYSAMKQVVLSLMPAAQAYVDAQRASPVDSPGQMNGLFGSNGKIAFSAILAYVNLITPYQKLATMPAPLPSSASSSIGGTTIQEGVPVPVMESEGWITAGSFYWRVEQMNTVASGLSVSQLAPTVGAFGSAYYTGTGSNKTISSDYSTMLKGALTSGTVYQSATNCDGVTSPTSLPGIQDTAKCVANLWTQYVGSQQNTQSSSNQQLGSGLLSTITGGALSGLLAFNYGLDSQYNPIAVLMSQGQDLLEVVVGMWLAAIGLTTLAMLAAWCSSTASIAWVLQALASWVKTITMTITLLLLVPGAILAYYVPLYPFAVYTFAAVGWLAMVIEGMAAAPLVAVGVTHPEGHDFMGRGEQAMMLMLGIFLRPALMVIGLIAAMITSFVAFKLLETGFQNVLASLAVNSAFGNDLLVIISIAMVLVIFGFMTMELIEQCFKLIYQLPNKIMTWIGQQPSGEEYGSMAKGVSGAVSSTASGIKEAVPAIGGATEKLAQTVGDHAQQKGGDGDLDVPGGGGSAPSGGAPGGGGGGSVVEAVKANPEMIAAL